MILRKLSQSLRVAMALMVATFSSGLLAPAVSVGALSTSPNNDCSAGLVFLEKYNWNSGGYALDTDSDGTSVSVAGNAEAGTFSTSGANVIVKEVHLKGGQVTDTDFYSSGTTSGSFNNSQLTSVNGSGKTVTHAISNVQFCGTVTPTGSLNVGVDCEEITFSAGAFAPAGGTVTFTLDGIAKDAGTYAVTPGDHTVVMSVNGTIVDTEVRTIVECEEEVVPPAGELTVSVDCKEGTFSGVVTAPVGGVATYKVNGNLTTPGTYSDLAPGSYTVEMFVNGTLVDSETVVVEACEGEVTPAGTLTVNVTCEAGSFSGAVTAPVGGTATYKVNGNVTTPGNYTDLMPGSYTVEMFVNGTLVDSKTVVVEACPAPDSENVTLCHATGSEKNPFVRITVSAEGAFNGHLGDDHQNGEDIIPEFTYNGMTYSQNWTEGMVITEECDVAQEVVPANVQFLNPTCENPTGRVVITATEGVTYKVGSTVVTGTVSYPGGTSVTVTAEASDESYVLDEEATTSWSHTFTAAPTGCVLGDNDVCPNIEGTQSVVPTGMIQNTMTDECFTPGRGGETPKTDTPQTLGAAVLPAVLPATGATDSPLMILAAALLAYGAAYFLQGRRLITRKEMIGA